jgi:hypothetical protein
MKKIFLVLSLFWATSVGAQNGDTLCLNRILDSEWMQRFPKNSPTTYEFDYLQFEDGSVLKVGDLMNFGVPSGLNQTVETSSGLLSGSVSRQNNFSYLMLGRMGFAAMAGITYLPENFKGKSVPIREIKMAKTKKGVPYLTLILENPGLDITVLDLSSALKFGELINPKASLTSDQALAELKKAKDKLDLGLITQTEYETLKSELSKLIK